VISVRSEDGGSALLTFLEQGGEEQEGDCRCAGALAAQGDLVRVAPEVLDVVPDPLQGHHEVQETLVARDLFGLQGQEAWNVQNTNMI
jgi:hypothetical protein